MSFSGNGMKGRRAEKKRKWIGRWSKRGKAGRKE